MGSFLRNPRYEMYAQGIISGLTPPQAYQKAGYKGKGAAISQLHNRPEVQQRIKELLDNFSKRAELSRKNILDRILEDWDTSRQLGQMAAALKAGHMLGSELHSMFVDRKEIGGPGDFDGKSEDELRQIISDGIKDLGWEDITIPPHKSIN